MDSAENEILEFIQSMNRCWTKGDPNDLKKYFHEKIVAITPSDKERLEGRDVCIAAWAAFAQNTKIHSWLEREHKIQLFGETAIVTYYFDISFDMRGQTISMSGRDMFTLVKEKGRWWAVADQFSPFPA